MDIHAISASYCSRSGAKSSSCYSYTDLLRFLALLVVVLATANWPAGASAGRPDETFAYTEVVGSARSPKLALGSSFVKTIGYQFVLDGKPLYVNGANLYWLMTYAADASSRSVVQDMLAEAASAGVTVGRTWAFADGTSYRPLQIRPGVYDESVFQGLDFAVAEAKKNGIRLILSLVNNYADFGGKPQYVAWAKTYAGASLSSDDDFFSDANTRAWYKNHVETVLTRVNTFTGVAYRDEPAIFAWELMNEPRCNSDTTGNTLQAWITEMAAYVKSLDSNHLLEVGLEGFYSSTVSPNSISEESANPEAYAAQLGTDFIRNNEVPEIDFATVHSYPDTWIPSLTEDEKRAFMGTWIRTHIDDAANKLTKPVVFAEFGKSARTPGYTESVRVAAMSDMFDAVYECAVMGGAGAGALVWQLVTSSLQSALGDGFEIVLTASPSIASLMRNQAARLSSL